MHNITLTVFTPAYNREKKLSFLYESLKKQSDKNFRWLIVDDGSTDGTAAVVDSFIKEGALDITYVYQKNGGKYKAHNHGVILCDTELFVCVDSDDSLLPDAVRDTKELWSKISCDNKICGIVSPRKMKGDEYFKNCPKKGTLMNLYNKGSFSGETMIVFRTDVLKKYLFPEIDGENFMSECVIYNQIDKEYVLYYDNRFHYAGEYLEDGLTRNAVSLEKKNPISTMITYKNIAAFQTDFIKAAKAYGSYLAWIEKYSLEDKFTDYRVKFFVKLAGALLKKHYKDLFARI